MIEYRDFEHRCRNQWRFVHDAEMTAFLDGIACEAAKHVEILPTEEPLWRARIGSADGTGHSDEDHYVERIAYDAGGIMPSREHAGESRVSPQGIPTLYAAKDQATAIAEVRPFVGAAVSVAELRANHTLRLVDCHSLHETDPCVPLFAHADDPAEAAWMSFHLALAEPLRDLSGTTRTDTYIATQVIAERLRRGGFDGITFKSSLAAGLNVAIFDPSSAEAVAGHLFTVRQMEIQYDTARHHEGW